VQASHPIAAHCRSARIPLENSSNASREDDLEKPLTAI
jgi:hypothetical protein